MKFCLEHWEKMREAVATRGMTALVSEGGEAVTQKMVREINGEDSVDTFDPLMHMHWAILNNLQPGLILWLQPNNPSGTECPLCYSNMMHKEVCDHQPGCQDSTHGHLTPWEKPKEWYFEHSHEGFFEWMIERSADDALDHWMHL
jgi:hypothetical protein